MRIATFNANSIRARADAIVDWLRRFRPDVLCIQETKVKDAAFPAAPFRECGYAVRFRGQKSYNGVAIASRLKPRMVRFGIDDGEEPDETRLVYAKIGPVHIVNTYVPQGRTIDDAMYAYKLRWLARLRAYFDRHFSPRARLVWVGDLNVAPTAGDIHNAEQQANHVCYHVDARAAFAEAVNWGFVDVFRQKHPDARMYTFFDYRTRGAVDRNMGWRIDHILATRSVAKRCTAAEIDLEPRRAARPSDHTFLFADFDL
jgi:exodeoxyribonuclease-3